MKRERRINPAGKGRPKATAKRQETPRTSPRGARDTPAAPPRGWDGGRRGLDGGIRILDITPRRVAPGARITIQGSGFSRYRNWNEVYLDGFPASIVRHTPRTLVVEVPGQVRDSAEVLVAVGGIPSNILPIEIEARLVRRPCGKSAASVVDVLGTACKTFILVQPESTLLPGGPFYLASRYVCGKNSALLPFGQVRPDFVQYILSIAGVNNPLLMGTSVWFGPPIFAVLPVTIQLVGRRERDPRTGEEVTVYYFFRNGRWWRVLDPERKHPDDPDGIDLREDVDDANFAPASPEVADQLNSQFFPTGWEEAWREFDPASRVQLQIMFAMVLQMEGMDAEDVELMLQIRRRLAEGATVDQVWEEKQSRILWLLVFAAGSAAALGLLGRLLRRIFKSRWLRRITDFVEDQDSIEFKVRPEYRPAPGRSGLQGSIRGRVDRGTGTLDCDPGAEEWINNTGKRGLATELFQDWIEQMIEYARRMGLRRIRIRRVASTPDGVRFLERSGFRPVPGQTRPDGTGIWERIVELE